MASARLDASRQVVSQSVMSWFLCMKLKIPFFDYLGARLRIPGPPIPHLAILVSPAPS